MDSYSGRFPLDFFSFYLGMTTDAQNLANVVPEDNVNEETRNRASADNNQPIETRPPSGPPTD